MSHVNKNSGTTILELMLAMAFVSTLLIAITMTTIHIGDMYNRGITLKEVDQAGQSLVGELQRGINQVPAFDVTTKFVKLQDGTDYYAGRLCTGKYSYIWNFGKVWHGTTYPSVNEYSGLSDKVRFVKVPDSTAKYCAAMLPDIDTTDGPTELLNVGDRELALHSFEITSASTDPVTGQQLYKIDFVIGTNEKDTIDAGYSSCKAPGATITKRDTTYCSINSFTITVRSGNKS